MWFDSLLFVYSCFCFRTSLLVCCVTLSIFKWSLHRQWWWWWSPTDWSNEGFLFSSLRPFVCFDQRIKTKKKNPAESYSISCQSHLYVSNLSSFAIVFLSSNLSHLTHTRIHNVWWRCYTLFILQRISLAIKIGLFNQKSQGNVKKSNLLHFFSAVS